MSKVHKQKVLMVHNYYQIPGGEDTVVANEKRLLEEHGHEVVLYTRHNDELKSMGNLRKLGLPFTTIFNPRTYRDIKRIIKEEKIEIVHVHNTLNLISPAVYYAAVKMKVPVVQTVHNFRFLCPGATFYRDGRICEDCVIKGLKCAIKHKCYRNSRAQTLICVISTWIHRHTGILGKINYICLTEFNKEKLLQLRYIKPENVFIKPNFTFVTIHDEGKNVVNEDGYYLYIGRIEKIKGLEVIMSAFTKIPDRKLKLAGTGTQIDEYKTKSTKNIEFLDFLNRDQLRSEIEGCKAVIVASQWYETFGMIIVEAYESSRPVIVGDIGNVSSLVEDGKTGVKFLYNDSDSLVNAICRFEEMDIHRLGNEGYKKYQKEFTPVANYKILEYVYNKID